MRQGDWKLLGNAWDTGAGDKSKPQTDLFLGNLAQDSGEKKDFAQAHPEVVERLLRAHEAWVKQAQR